MNDRGRTDFPLVPLVAFGKLCSDVAVMSLDVLFLVFDARAFFIGAAPVCFNVFFDELDVQEFGLVKTLRSRQHAVDLDEGIVGYWVCSEPSVVTCDSPQDYEDLSDPDHGGRDRRRGSWEAEASLKEKGSI